MTKYTYTTSFKDRLLHLLLPGEEQSAVWFETTAPQEPRNFK